MDVNPDYELSGYGRFREGAGTSGSEKLQSGLSPKYESVMRGGSEFTLRSTPRAEPQPQDPPAAEAGVNPPEPKSPSDWSRRG